MRVLLAVILKEIWQLRRDRKMIPAMIVGPVAQLLALGFAANLDVTDITLVLVDQDRSAASRSLVQRFEASGTFRLVGALDTSRPVDRWLATGEAQIALVIDAGYGRDLASGRGARVQVLADGTDSKSALVGMGYASRIVAAAGAEIVTGASGVARAGPIELVPRVWYNPDLKSRWFYLPGILALVLMLLTMILPSVAVVREKEIGTLEQLIVTPVRPWQLVLGKLAPFFVIGMIVTTIVTAIVVLLFRVPLRGSLPLLLALTALFLMSTLGFGLLVSTLVRTQQQAMMAATFLLMVPMIYLSGLIFPIENMPAAIRAATYAIPLRYYNNIIRGIFLKGSGIEVLWPEALALVACGTVVLGLASVRFSKTLD